MKLTLASNLAFLKVYNIIKSNKSLSIKTAFGLTQLSKVAQEHSAFYREQFEKIINTYAKKDENGNIIKTEDGNGIQIEEGAQQACFAQLTELDLLEVELPDIKFHLEDFENAGLSPEDLEILMPFLNIE